LVNKILGVLLIPLVIVIAFSPVYIAQVAVIISLLLTAALFLLRFIRSYNLLHRQIKVSRFHFFLYIAGIELLPVLLIYKGVVILLDKNL
jgi:predicted membrane metal-binding protein